MKVPSIAGLHGHHDPRVRLALHVLAVLVAVMLGSLAFSLAAQSSGRVGPVTVGVRLTPSVDGETTLEFPPFGRVRADTHLGLLSATATLEEVDVDAVQALAANGPLPPGETEGWVAALRDIVTRAALAGLLAAVLAAAATARTLTRSWRSTLVAVLLVVALPGGALALSAKTFDEQAFREPTFEGALTYAPAAFSLVQQKVTDIQSLQQQAKGLAASLAAYYGVSQSIAPGGTLPGTYRVLHVSDLHLDPVGLQLASELAEAYDVEFVIDTGDMAYFGSEQEGSFAVSQLTSRPYIFVPGNHDSASVIASLATRPNVTVLDGETTTTPSGISVLGVGDPMAADSAFEPDADAATRRGREVAGSLETTPGIVAVHDPRTGAAFKGAVAVVLSGHTHAPSLSVSRGTVFLGSGTTGGVDFGDLKSDPQIPHTADILYFSKEEPGRLVAVDQIEVYGKTRQSSIRRTIVDEAFVRPE